MHLTAIISLTLALLSIIYVSLTYLRNLRVANIDLMGAAVGFDRLWFVSMGLLAIGMTLLMQWHWGLGLLVLMVGFLCGMPVKRLLYRMSGRR